MNPNAELLNRFYSAFQKRDHKTMIACYHEEISFKDEVFDLKGKQAGAMWHMLCEQGTDLTLEFSDIQADAEHGKARWEAHYTFSKTKKKVHNIIHAEFEFKDGKILRHRDQFDLWKWSRQALGLIGLALGWTPFMRKEIQAMAGKQLQRFIDKHPGYHEK